MARTTRPLTNTEAKQAKPNDKIYNLFDGHGLVLRVHPNGSKKWLFNYVRPYTKIRTSLSFGSYPHISIAEARTLREHARALLAKNTDPKTHRDEQDQQSKSAKENTLQTIADSWLKVKRTKVSEDHASKLFSSLKLHIFPMLGRIPINEIKAPVVIDTLKPLAAEGKLETVRRVCQRLNEVMHFAVNSGLIDHNPLAKISEVFETPVKQHLVTLPPEQLPALMKAISQASIKRTTRCLLEWQLHTIARPGEAAGTRWEEINIETKLWTIPGERMKKGKEHTIPLSQQCLDILEAIRPISGHREFVFPADRNPRAHTNPQTANRALERMGYRDRLVAHGLRSIASTTLNEKGFDPDIIESALSHVDKNEVRRAYNRAQYLEQRRTMMDWWSDHISQAAMGSLSVTSINLDR